MLRWEAGRSALGGRSACDNCGRTLRAWELVPVISALAQRGRCRRCGATIDPLHLRMELASAGAAAATFALQPPLAAAAWSVFGLGLLTLAIFDLRAFWLPDALTAPLAIAGLLAGGLATGVPTLDRVAGGVAGWASLAALGWLFRRVRRIDALGGGDPKLAGAIGCWIGWLALAPLWALAGLAGLVLVGLERGGGPLRTRPIPFGAALAVAAVPAWWLVAGASGLSVR